MADAIAVAALLVAIVSCLATLALYAEVGRLALRLDPDRSNLPLVPNEIPNGAVLPETLLNRFPDGTPVPLNQGMVVLIFLASNCEPCRLLWPDLQKFAAESTHSSVVAIVGDDPLYFSGEAGVRVPQIIFDSRGDLADRFQVKRTPFAYLVDGGHVRSKGVVNSYKQLVTLSGGHGLPQQMNWQQEARR